LRRTVIALIAAAGAALTGTFLAIEPAQAATRDTRLIATLRPATGPVRAVWLSCRPAGGNHPKAAAACATLAQAGGDPRRIEPADGMCTMEYAPVTATLNGRWRGRAVRYRVQHGNACALGLATGPVFQF